MFGGSAKPKLATEKVNVRKEKEKAMAWIKDESKKYDQQQMLQDVEMHMQSIAVTVRREQKDMTQDELRQIARLEKLEHLVDDLHTTKAAVNAQRDTMRGLKEKASLNFKEFDNARAANLKDA